MTEKLSLELKKHKNIKKSRKVIKYVTFLFFIPVLV